MSANKPDKNLINTVKDLEATPVNSLKPNSNNKPVMIAASNLSMTATENSRKMKPGTFIKVGDNVGIFFSSCNNVKRHPSRCLFFYYLWSRIIMYFPLINTYQLLIL